MYIHVDLAVIIRLLAQRSASIIYTIILLMDSVSLSVALICGLYRPSSEPIALRKVLKCSTRHTLLTIRFLHFSLAVFIEKKQKTAFARLTR